MKTQVSAGIIAYYIDNGVVYYLLLQNPGRHWDFSKGKMEEGEQKIETAVRELKEEAGLEVVEVLPGFEDRIEYYFRFGGDIFYKQVYFFLGKVDRTAVVLSREHCAYEWLDYEQAYQRISYQNSKDVLKRAHLFLLNKNGAHP